MAYGVGDYGTTEYGVHDQNQERSTKNTRQTVNTHPGTEMQIVTASQGI